MKKINLNELPPTEKLQAMREICQFLTEQICVDLFPGVNSDAKTALDLGGRIDPKRVNKTD
jgi:hypothetical protein